MRHFIDEENGQAQVITADYIVCCNGANSLVRKKFDSDLEDLGFCEKWLVVDMLLKKRYAAHLTPPFMGQGMCAGVKDAANLVWKLALCVKNKAGDEILQSSAHERIPHVKAYISTAVSLGQLIYSAEPVSALTASFGQEAGYAKMKSISPLLGAADFFIFRAPL